MNNIDGLSYQELLDLYKNINSYLKELQGELDKYKEEDENNA